MPVFRTRGHPVAVAAVAAMIAGRTPHAILISGPGGVGKTTLALDLATGLLCDAPDPADRPCRACRGCRLVERGLHGDLHRLAPGGRGDVIGIGGSQKDAPGIRELVSDLALLAVEGGARVALLERAHRMTEEAQSALLKTLEEPPSGVTVIICADREDLILPTVRSRCVRLRLGPVPTREVEAILTAQAVADAPTAARLAHLSAGRPGLARAHALAPATVIARDEISRSLLDLLAASPSRRLASGRDLIKRADDVTKGLDRAVRDPDGGADAGRAKRGARSPGPLLPASPVVAERAEVNEDGETTDGAETGGSKASPGERRRTAAMLVAIWQDVARDLALVELGEERHLRDPGLLDDLRVAAVGLPPGGLAAFLLRLDHTAQLLDANVSPELALDVLFLTWPHRGLAA